MSLPDGKQGLAGGGHHAEPGALADELVDVASAGVEGGAIDFERPLALAADDLTDEEAYISTA